MGVKGAKPSEALKFGYLNTSDQCKFNLKTLFWAFTEITKNEFFAEFPKNGYYKKLSDVDSIPRRWICYIYRRG